MALDDALGPYKAKRNFSITPEPREGGTARPGALQFVIQKHWATRLHYDLRLELDGTMKSWAVPKGPSYDPHDKRMAVQVEDHPISYNTFEGLIPEKQYGAGKVIVWDKGIWVPDGDARQGYRDGKLKFTLYGHKLHGHWTLVRMKSRDAAGERQPPWLLIKEHDEWARPAAEFSVVDDEPDSVGSLASPGAPSAAGPASPAVPPPGGVAEVLQGAERARLPTTLTPQLATLVDGPPTDPENWVYEIKFDGYRLLARVDGASVRLFTRNGHDWTDKLPHLAEQLKAAGLPPCWLDGEIVVNGDNGVPDFQALQNAFDRARTQTIVYFVFDLPFCDGCDLRGVALGMRRATLQTLMGRVESESLRFSEVFDAPGRDIVLSACRIGLEGVIAKRRDSVYRGSRSTDWIKLKCGQRQEFVIGGWTDPQGTRAGFGALLLGVHDGRGKLRHAGNVGSGFTGESLAALRRQLDALARDGSPFSARTAIDRKAHWVEPTLIAEVSFSGWTATGSVRHAVFHGLRADRPAGSIVREEAAPAPPPKPTTTTTTARVLPAGLKVSSPERLIDPESGTTKIDVVRYYARVAALMLPHLAGRPVSLVRAPDGLAGPLFFQKHLERYKLAGVRELDPALDPAHGRYLEIATRQGLLSSAQMNVIEFHTWNAVKTAIGKPDRMTFDLDPGDGVDWDRVRQAAGLVRVLLDELELGAFLKTSGGKGLHVVVPLKKQYGWEVVKDFSHAVVEHLARTLPQLFVAKSGPRNRVGRIFADYLRNGFGATTASAWTLRSRPGVGVSVPVAWDELDGIESGTHWTLADIDGRFAVGNAPWDGFAAAARSPRQAMEALGFRPGGTG